MANNGYIQVPADSVGKKVDASSLTVGSDIVIRQRIVIADPSAPNSQVIVTSAGALTVIHQGPLSITGQVTGVMSLSGVIQVSNVDPIILGPSTQNVGGVSLVAGTANIGFIDSISKTVQVAMATRIGIDNISATVSVLNTGFIEKTSNSIVQVGDSANAALRVNIVAGAASGVSQIDGTSFTSQAANFVPIGGIFDDAGTDTLSENDAGVVRLTTARAFHANLRTDGGVKLDDSANSALRVNIVAGAAAGVSQIDDTSFTATAANFVPIGGCVDDTGTSTISENHAGSVRMTTYRAFHVNLRDALGNEISAGNALNVNIQNISKTASVVLAAGTANIGTVNGISATVSVLLAGGTALIGAVSLGAGTSNIGFINNISATVVVAGIVNVSNTHAVVLAAGTANFGTLNNISKTVEVTVSTPFTINGISATVTTAWSTPQTVNGISATVTVTTANPWIVATQSGSHGPVTALFSTSATTSFITAPGAGNFVYVTMLAGTNAGTVSTVFNCGASVSTGEVQMFMVSAGGGFVLYFDPPWRLPGNEALLGFVNPNSSGKVRIVTNFFVRNS